MPMFMKKPIPVEARQFTIETSEEVSKWTGSVVSKRPDGTPNAMLIYNLEGVTTAQINDWIIKGVRGEFYTCVESIFNQTYEEVK